jgi:hypothetical protein
MTMNCKSINIEYWIHPNGIDFEGIDQFSSNIEQNSFLTINKKRTDSLGGGRRSGVCA